VGEGRLAAHSLVAREGSTDWHEAREEPEFSDVFTPRAPAAASAAPRGSADMPTQKKRALPSAQLVAGPSAHVNATEATDQQTAHFVVIIEFKSRSAGNIETAIASLGPNYRLNNNVWILSTEQSVSTVRNRLVQELGKLDSLFVIDASRGKAAWSNFGPEADVRIRRVWQKS
jgi:hypothetical protein